MRVLFGVMLGLVYMMLTYYIGINVETWLHSLGIELSPIIYWSIIYLIAFSFVIARFHEQLSKLAIIGCYWFFVFEYGLLLCLFADIIYMWTPFKNIPLLGFISIAVLITLFIKGTYNAYTPTEKELNIRIHKQSKPLKIIVASDFHLGLLSSKKQLKNFVQRSNAFQPDLVLLVGDIVDDNPVEYERAGMDRIMRELKSNYGVYGVLGNHEHIGNQVTQFITIMEKSNIRILKDETILINNELYLTGRDDLFYKGRSTLDQLQPQQQDLPWIVMNHTPNDIQSPAHLNVDLHVSGHTHKGQLWPNSLITKRVFELDYGYKKIKNMHAIVSSGFGFWGPPVRIGSQSELWKVTIQCDDALK